MMIDTFPSRSFTVSFDDDGSTILIPNRPPLEEEEEQQQAPEEEHQVDSSSEQQDVAVDSAVSLYTKYTKMIYDDLY